MTWWIDVRMDPCSKYNVNNFHLHKGILNIMNHIFHLHVYNLDCVFTTMPIVGVLQRDSQVDSSRVYNRQTKLIFFVVIVTQ